MTDTNKQSINMKELLKMSKEKREATINKLFNQAKKGRIAKLKRDMRL